MKATIFIGNCVERLKELGDNSVDSIVTDPPYHLTTGSSTGFMGMTWDGGDIAHNVDMWRQCLRVLKPGGYLLAFGGSRTYHRMACAVEDAGFEIRDNISYYYSNDVDRNAFLDSLTPEQCEVFLDAFGRPSQLDWNYGSGFPKSLSVAKAMRPQIESRYGKSSCNCLDPGNGRTFGNNGRCQGGKDVRVQRTPSGRTTEEVGDCVISVNEEGCYDPVRDLRNIGNSEATGYEKSKASVLFKRVCERGAEAPGLGDIEIWTGLEEREGDGTRTGQSMPDVRENSTTERDGSSCSSSETVSLWGDESIEQSGSSVRVMPSSSRNNNRTSFIVDPNRSETRRVISDDLCGWDTAVAHVCSWCGRPDKEWMTAISSLGTALKPAHEPIVVARKPLIGTVAQNVQQYGTGALNIDGCRIGVERVSTHSRGISEAFPKRPGETTVAESGRTVDQRSGLDLSERSGRWPANVILSYPEDEYELRLDVSESDRKELYRWLSENS